MTNYDQLKSAIQAANPEIMELKFGCELLDIRTDETAHVIGEVLYFGDEGDYELSLIAFDKKVDVPFKWGGIGDERLFTADYKTVERKVDFKILGRPIQLADVLLAIRATEPKNGDFHKWNNDWQRIIVEWNLKDDNLDHQSEETKQFLINLLVP